MVDEERLRIGELSRRVGLSEHVLRVWERRYGVLRPTRTDGGFRLYDARDERRVRRMQQALSRGLSTAEAARSTLNDDPVAPVPDLAEGRRRLAAALDVFDEATAQDTLEGLLAAHAVDDVLGDVVLPYLHELGERWADGRVDVSQEHFASNVLRGRLAHLLRGVERPGPTVVLACPPGELHDLPLLVLGVSMSHQGWRAVFLGADTPLPDLAAAVRRLQPDLVVLGATLARHFEAVAEELSALSGATTLALGGAGASRAVADRVGARLLEQDPVTSAAHLCTEHLRPSDPAPSPEGD